MKTKRKFLSVIIIFLLVGILGCYAKQESNIDVKHQKMIQMYTSYKQKLFPQVKEITVSQVADLKQDHVFVDIRDKREQEVSMLPYAITQDEFEKDIDQYKDKTIVLYCTIGNRSGRYAKKLSEQGITAYNLAGGILAWAWEDNNLQSDQGPTNKVHVYGPRWNLLPDDYDPVW
jgi:rhodanese-related sulfurtransferase